MDGMLQAALSWTSALAVGCWPYWRRRLSTPMQAFPMFAKQQVGPQSVIARPSRLSVSMSTIPNLRAAAFIKLSGTALDGLASAR